ncbi:MAG: competence/damage-inducible protein A [Ignavibacteriaceae bacterium]
MNAHILTIGDEILIGQTLNTNAAFIGSVLTAVQVRVKKTSVVGDTKEDIIKEFEDAWQKSDLLIVTGGLGPTHDDVTLNCIIDFFKTELVMDEEVLENVKKIFGKRGLEVTKVNENQALVPKIASVIKNELGTAPGIWIEKDEKIFAALPGVPYEMRAMMENYVIPNLRDKLKNLKTIVKMINLQTTGIPESVLFERLGDIDELLGGARLAFLPSPLGIKLRISAEEESEESAIEKLNEVEQKIRSKAGRFIFAKGEESLEEVVGRLLKERGFSIAIAESCTGGNICNLITNIKGSSNYFERGVVSYSNASKVEILKVNEDTIAEHGAVSLEVARQMAEGVKSISGTDLGLAITGIMGPTGAAPGKPVGLVYVGLCDDKVCTAKKFIFGDDRLLNKQRATQAALEMVRKYLLGISADD